VSSCFFNAGRESRLTALRSRILSFDQPGGFEGRRLGFLLVDLEPLNDLKKFIDK
jgi:hypothetical protein